MTTENNKGSDMKINNRVSDLITNNSPAERLGIALGIIRQYLQAEQDYEFKTVREYMQDFIEHENSLEAK